MAPELIRGAKRARSDADIFGFGVIAYELLTGQLPSETPPIMMLLKPSQRWYAPLALRCPALPAQLAQLIERCLDAAPENRPSAAELFAALRENTSARPSI
jgi:serine/threonine-protein kinase